MFFQTNEQGLFVGQSMYGSKGYGDVAVSLAEVPTGHVARWESSVDRNDAEYGEPGSGRWVVIEDHRSGELYTTDGARYEMGSDVDGQTYDGLGPVPNWLTDTAPEPEPAPPVYPQFSANEVLDLFTEGEQRAVASAAMSNVDVKLWYDRMIASNFVTYEDPRTEGGLQALVDAELITAQRKGEIVAAMQPA